VWLKGKVDRIQSTDTGHVVDTLGASDEFCHLRHHFACSRAGSTFGKLDRDEKPSFIFRRQEAGWFQLEKTESPRKDADQDHQDQRRTLDPGFHPAGIRGSYPLKPAVELVEKLIQALSLRSDFRGSEQDATQRRS